MKRYRTAIIGLGKIGFGYGFDRKREQPAAHSRAFNDNPRISLEGGCDLITDTLKKWVDCYPNARGYSSVEELLEDGQWDVLVIAIDEEYHLPMLEKIIDRPPSLIVLEKPVAPNLSDAKKMLDLVKRKYVPVMVNHERRFSNDYLWVRDRIHSGEYGSLVAVHAGMFTQQFARLPNDEVDGQGALIHDGTHLLDIIRFMINDSITFKHVEFVDSALDGSVKGITGMGNIGEKTPLVLHCGYGTEHFTFEIEIILEKGRIRVGNTVLEEWKSEISPYYESFHSLIKQPIPNNVYPTGYFSGMVQACVDYLDGSIPLPSSLAEGVKSIELIHSLLSFLR